MARWIALVLLCLGFGSSEALADDPPIVVVFESPRALDAEGLRSALVAAGVPAVGVADARAAEARETLTIAFGRDDRSATAWWRTPRGAEQRLFVSPTRDRSGRWVITHVAALVRAARGAEVALAHEPSTTEVLDPWASPARVTPPRMHRVPTVEVLDPWADHPPRRRRAPVVRPVASPEVLDPWHTPPPEPAVTEVVDPWAEESGARLAPPR